ncbi:MAG TPA: hydrolase [Tepidisphaeraceae bacterium]|nr:hydrolase [Tepidisphaeraceae bacterium]
MSRHQPTLDWIDSQSDRLRSLVIEWADINSGSHNLDGLAKFAAVLKRHFSTVGDVHEIALPSEQVIDSRGQIIVLPLGKALSIRKRPDAPLRVFLGIHMDTVYGADDPFQKVAQIDANILRGPGVVDAKGGLAVMLVALEALERSDVATSIGWEVFINPDEEIGSPGSSPFFVECAKRNHLGLVFEPTMPDGAMVSERKGSGSFSVVIHGRAAHAGRDFQLGRNAILAASDYVVRANRLNGTIPDTTLNVGRIDGGGPVNIVPDLAIVRLNVRVARLTDQQTIERELSQLATEIAKAHDVTVALHGHFASPPKVLDDRTRALCGDIEQCGRELGIPVTWKPSGGASDGNKLAAAGLPVIDTFGPRGGELHSPREFLLLDSLAERAKLAALLLLKLAGGEFDF